jgi:hypothetical protein
MQLIPIESTALFAIGYDSAAQRLKVQFRDGTRYEYLDVPERVHAALMHSRSKGLYFNTSVRGQFRYNNCGAARKARI